MTHVYDIRDDKDNVIYIGLTGNIKRREYQHNYNLRKGKENKLYDYFSSSVKDLSDNSIIKLNIIKSFKNRVEAKRYECMLILIDYFTDRNLKQKVPNISDR